MNCKYFKKIIVFLGLICSSYAALAQTSIVTNGSDSITFTNGGAETVIINADSAMRIGGVKFTSSSSILELNSTSRGLLIPRMTGAQRNAIADPKPGMVIYNISTGKFNFYDGGSWAILLASNGNFPFKIEDSDGDTRVTVQEGGIDSDTIRFYTNGTEKMILTSAGNLGVGTSNPSATNQLEVVSAAGTAVSATSAAINTTNAALAGGAANATEMNIGVLGDATSSTASDTAFGVIGTAHINAGSIGVGVTGVTENVKNGTGMGVQGISKQDPTSTSGNFYGGAFTAEGLGSGGSIFALFASATGSGSVFSGYFNDGDVYINDSLGLGTAPGERLGLNGRMEMAPLAAPGVTTNKLYNVGGDLFWDGVQLNVGGSSAWTATGTTVILTSQSDSVGIGTSSPVTKFHIREDNDVTPDSTLVYGGGRLGVGTQTPSSTVDVVGNVSSTQFANSDDLPENIAAVSGVSSEAGNIGFDIDKYGLAGVASIGGNTSGASGNESVIAGVYGGAEIIGSPGAGTILAGVFGEASGTGGFAGYFPNGKNYFGGNVGIGTTTPAAELDVDVDGGTILIPRKSTTGDPAGGANGMIYYNELDGKFRVYENGTWKDWVSTAANPGWELLGNTGNTDGVEFLGTIDDIPLTIKVFNKQSGRIESDNFNGNTFYGYETGTAVTSAGYNTGVGLQTFNAITTGNENSAFGAQTLFTNTSGNSNTAIGNYALYLSTTGSFNTALGRAAMYQNTVGGNNTALGRDALYNNIAGSNATAVGYQAMYNSNNTATPYTNFSVALGYQALRGSVTPASNTGNYNTGVGYQALFSYTSGSNNTSIGHNAGYTVTSGTNNTFLGYNADASDATITNATAVGANTQVDASNTVILGNGADVGIGTSLPLGKLHVHTGDNTVGGIIVSSATATGNEEPYLYLANSRGTGASPAAIGSGDRIGGLAFVAHDGTDYEDAAQIVARATQAHTSANKGTELTFYTTPLNTSITNPSLHIADVGNVGIGTTTPSEQLHLENGIFMMTTVSAPGTTVDRLYNVGGNLYWDGTQLNTGGVSEWTKTGNHVSLAVVNDSVGIGTASPTAPLEVAGRIVQSGTGQSLFIGEGAGANDDFTNNNNTYLGYNAGNAANTSGVTAVGTNAFASSTGGNNTAIGWDALTTSSGGQITAVGVGAAKWNTSGISHTAIGMYAAYSNTVGNENTAIGYQSLYFNVAGHNSTAIGHQALMYADNTATPTFKFNTAVGYQALMGSTTAANNTGTQNTAIGHQAMRSFTSGSFNTALGYMALRQNTTGSNNTAVGRQANYDNTTGIDNVALGFNTLNKNVAGNRGTALGTNALRYANDQAGSYTNGNVAIGYESIRGSTTAASNTGNNNTAVGYQTMVTNTTGANNVAMGYHSLFTITTGSNNTAIGYDAGYNGGSNALTTGSNNTFIGYNTGLGSSTQRSNAAAIGYESKVDTSNALILGGTGANAVNVGIGVTKPQAVLDVTSDGGTILIPRKSTTGDPTGGVNGMIYYNEVDGKFRVFENGAWTDWVGAGGGDNLGDHTATTNIQLGSNYLSGDGGSEGIAVDASGNVGINTTAPTQTLQVHTPAATPSYAAFTNTSTGATVSDGLVVGESNTGMAFFYNYENANMRFATNGTNVMELDNAGNVGIGTTTPSYRLHVETSGAGVVPQVAAVQGGAGDASMLFKLAGTDDYTIGIDNSDADKFKISNNSSLGANDRLVIDNTGNIGVGTSTPSALLHLSGTAAPLRMKVENNATTFGPEINLINTAAGGRDWRIGSAQSSNGAGQGKFFIHDGTAAADRMVIDANGWVGINTNAPAAILDVTGTDAIIIPQGTTAQRPGTPEVGMLRYNTTTLKLEGYENGTWSDLVQTPAGDDLGNHTATTNIQLGSNYLSGDGGNEGIAVDASGNVGIGTNTPGRVLDITGSSGTNMTRITNTNANGWSTIQLDNNVSNSVAIGVGGSTAATQANIGYLQTNGSIPLQFNTNSTVRMHISETGEVGIGTTTPSEEFHLENGVFMMTTVTTPGTTADRLYNVGGNLYWNGTQLDAGGAAPWTKSGASIYNTTITDNVGIGLTNPSFQFHQASNSAAYNVVQTSTGAAANSILALARTRGSVGSETATLANDNLGELTFLNHDGTNWQEGAMIRAVATENTTGSGSGSELQFRTTANGTTAANTRLVITNAGSVGIGTTTPGNVLEIKSTGTGTNVFSVERSGGTESIFRAEETSSGSGRITLFTSGGVENVRITAGGSDSYINNSLNFGLGTNAPNAKLHVVGDVLMGNSTAGDEGVITVLLTNNTGANSVKGEIVVVDATTNNAFNKVATAADASVIGVVYETGVANGAPCKVAISGIVAVTADAATTRGQHCVTGSTTAGRAGSVAIPGAGTSIGVWLENVAAGAQGKVLLR